MEEQRRGSRPIKPSTVIMQLQEDMKALNSAISLLSQKMSNIARNEKILGRNLIVLNKKVKNISQSQSSENMPENLAQRLEQLEKEVETVNRKIDDLNAVVSSLRKEFVSRDEFQEMKQIIDAINPLEVVTADEVKELIEKNNKTQHPRL